MRVQYCTILPHRSIVSHFLFLRIYLCINENYHEAKYLIDIYAKITILFHYAMFYHLFFKKEGERYHHKKCNHSTERHFFRFILSIKSNKKVESHERNSTLMIKTSVQRGRREGRSSMHDNLLGQDCLSMRTEPYKPQGLIEG